MQGPRLNSHTIQQSRKLRLALLNDNKGSKVLGMMENPKTRDLKVESQVNRLYYILIAAGLSLLFIAIMLGMKITERMSKFMVKRTYKQ